MGSTASPRRLPPSSCEKKSGLVHMADDDDSTTRTEEQFNEFLASDIPSANLSHFGRACFAEFLGSMLMVYASTCSLLFCYEISYYQLAPDSCLYIALAQGLSVATGMMLVDYLAGEQQEERGYLNPAYTLACMVTRRLQIPHAMILISCQFVGGVFGAIFTLGTTPHANEKGIYSAGSMHVEGGTKRTGNAFVLEAMISFFIVFVMWGINYGWDPKPSAKTYRSSLVCGLTTVAGLLVEIPIIGSGANPVRAMASNLVSETFDGTEWVYVFGPLFGGVLGGLAFQYCMPHKGKMEQ